MTDKGIGHPLPYKLKPFVVWKHIDGPMMACSDDSVYWLTWRDRLRLMFGLTTIGEIDRIQVLVNQRGSK